MTVAKYTITAGSNSTDLKVVGHAATLLGAKRIGRKAVLTMLPNGEGTYMVIAPDNTYKTGERSIRTNFRWID